MYLKFLYVESLLFSLADCFLSETKCSLWSEFLLYGLQYQILVNFFKANLLILEELAPLYLHPHVHMLGAFNISLIDFFSCFSGDVWVGARFGVLHLKCKSSIRSADVEI